MSANAGIIYAAFILIGLYIMIIFEVIKICEIFAFLYTL